MARDSGARLGPRQEGTDVTLACESPIELRNAWRAQGLWRDVAMGEAMAAAAAHTPAALLHIRGAEGATQATLTQVHQHGRALAGSLAALGVGRGDTVAMQLPNCLENAVVFQAAAALGCTLLPIVHIYGPAELAHILADSGAGAIIVPDRWRGIDYLERLERLPDLPHLAHRIVLGDDVPPGCLAWSALPAGEAPKPPSRPDDIALLLYTSGTTAAPKGVRHSSRTLLAELFAQVRSRQSGGWFAPWPAGHIAGTLGILAHGVLGRDVAMLESWDAAAAAELIERFQVEQTSGTPFHLTGILQAAARDHRDLSSLEQFVIGATTVPPALVAEAEDAGVRCVRCYGSTELPTLTQCAPGDPLDKRLNTDGRLNPGCEVRFLDDAGEDVPLGREGELAVRGPERFVGYSDPDLDAAAFLPGGWFLTGDIGRMDGDGFVTITDRKKDIIIRGGENISSREVEELLLRLPGVVEAAAIGWPDRDLGERVCAVLRMAGEERPSLAEVAALFAEIGVARQKAPERLAFVDDFPRTPSGKVQKASLRRQLLAASETGGGAIHRQT
jgi:acyl-CoA synthetase (AMP-forming)/AMP-acid ligase II